MARIAEKYASVLILTSDNPRTEKPEQIIDDMQQGLLKRDRALLITDRKEAIKTACAMANSGDIILIPGKGHEPYQEIMGVKYPFNDKTIVNEFLNN
ncbi:MAG TPA: hypothetical protein DCQ31_01815 [Bacteroidales bacterium]|nr:hypothetical protein [Bacteroidales bacterium]